MNFLKNERIPFIVVSKYYIEIKLTKEVKDPHTEN